MRMVVMNENLWVSTKNEAAAMGDINRAGVSCSSCHPESGKKIKSVSRSLWVCHFR